MCCGSIFSLGNKSADMILAFDGEETSSYFDSKSTDNLEGVWIQFIPVGDLQMKQMRRDSACHILWVKIITLTFKNLLLEIQVKTYVLI